ncbi:MAG: FmdB family zinc ribbon protein [Nitrospinaceae bacterium]
MPIYDYECEKCKKTFEVLQKPSDPPIEECEHCGGPAKKVITGMNFHLYGPGFFVTDNKRKYLK